MIILAALLLATFVASALSGGAWWDIPANELLHQGANFAPAVAGGERWRLISAQFLHGGLLHAGFNILALIQIGRMVERQIGPRRALVVFLLAGAWGFLASLLWQPEIISVGASGGIFGLLGAWAVQTIRDIGTDGSPRRSRGRLSVIVALLLALGLGFLVPNVDHAAHLGGLGVGILLGSIAHPRKWRWPVFFAATLTLGIGLYFTTLHLPASWRIEYDETHQYARHYLEFAEEDRRISKALQAIGEASRQNVLSDTEGLSRLDLELLPRLARLAAGWQERSWQTTRIARDAVRWTTYSRLRLDAVTALRNAIAAEDLLRAQDELNRFERLMTEAAQLTQPSSLPSRQQDFNNHNITPPSTTNPPDAASR